MHRAVTLVVRNGWCCWLMGWCGEWTGSCAACLVLFPEFQLFTVIFTLVLFNIPSSKTMEGTFLASRNYICNVLALLPACVLIFLYFKGRLQIWFAYNILLLLLIFFILYKPTDHWSKIGCLNPASSSEMGIHWNFQKEYGLFPCFPSPKEVLSVFQGKTCVRVHEVRSSDNLYNCL